MKQPLGRPVYNPDGPFTTTGRFVLWLAGLSAAGALAGWYFA